MKKLLLLLALVVVCTFKANTQPNLAVEYRFENSAGSTMLPQYVNGAILSAASPFYTGSGLVTSTPFVAGANSGIYGCGCEATDQATHASNWGTVNSNVVNLSDHFGWTITQLGGNTVVIDSVTWLERRSGTGPQLVQMRTSSDGYAAPIWIGSNSVTTYVQRSVTTGLPSFSAPLDIRIYGYRPTSLNGTFRIDSVRVYAHIESPLPITLTSFTGEVSGDASVLRWTTVSESNNSHFTLFRSSDMFDWKEIGTLPGAGTSVQVLDYSFTDQNPDPGDNYYRLRQTDFDGIYEEPYVVVVNHKLRIPGTHHHVGDILSLPGERSTLFGVSGSIISPTGDAHHLQSSGVYILMGEYGSKLRILVY